MIQKTVADAAVPLVFELGTTDLYEDTKFLLTKRDGKIDVSGQNTRTRPYSGHYPTLFVHQNTNYDFETLFAQADVEFVTFLKSGVGSMIMLFAVARWKKFEQLEYSPRSHVLMSISPVTLTLSNI